MIRIYPAHKKLHPKHTFRISRAAKPFVENVFLAVEQDGVTGYGEASPNIFFNEDPWNVKTALAGLADYFRRQTVSGPEDIARIWEEVWEKVAPSRACQCTIDLALWDLLAKQMGVTAGECALGRKPRDIATSVTLGICPREEWPERLAELSDFSSIKVKMDASADMDIIRFIRDRSQAAIRVDANGAWSAANAPALVEKLAALGVELIEQPLPPSEDGRMAALLKDFCLPVFADESCATTHDIVKLPGRFSGFNIKLVKCGGLTPALSMLRMGRAVGLKVMVGCMLESSLLISAGVIAAQNADYADLDGSWLLRDDPFEGLEINRGRLWPSEALGLGVTPKDQMDISI
jgi:L-Ala-D/L-Glu epimerase